MLKEGKFSRYLLYAVGEIALVVIGILIALQINNRNEKQKQNDQLEQYKVNLIAELSLDVAEIETLNRLVLESKKSVLDYFNYYQQEELNIDTLIAKKNAMNAKMRAFNKSSYTLQELSNTGKIALFNDEEKKAIVGLKNLQAKYDFLEKAMADIGIKSYEIFASKVDVLYEENRTTKEHTEFRGWRFNVDATQYRLLNNHLESLLSMYEFQAFKMYPELKKATLELKELLNRK